MISSKEATRRIALIDSVILAQMGELVSEIEDCLEWIRDKGFKLWDDVERKRIGLEAIAPALSSATHTHAPQLLQLPETEFYEDWKKYVDDFRRTTRTMDGSKLAEQTLKSALFEDCIQRVVDHFEKMLSHSPFVCDTTLKIVARSRLTEFEPKLRAFKASASARQLQEKIDWALNELGPRDIETLKRQFQEKNFAARIDTLNKLDPKLETVESSELIEKGLADAEPDVRCAAIYALEKFRKSAPNFAEIMLAATTDEQSARVRETALRVLIRGVRDVKMIREVIVARLRDAAPSVKSAALEHSRFLGSDQSALETLAAAALDPDLSTKALKRLYELAYKNKAVLQKIPVGFIELGERLLDAENDDAASNLAFVLGQIGDPAALSFLERLANSDLRQSTGTAIGAIGYIGGGEAVSCLQKLSAQENHPRRRLIMIQLQKLENS